MLELFNKLIHNQTFLTIISGVLVYVLGQLILEFIIKPKVEYRKLIQKIAYTITMYACYYSNPYDLNQIDNNKKQDYSEVSKQIRNLGAEIAGYIGTLPIISIKRKKLNNILNALIGISNGLFKSSENDNPIRDNRKFKNEIERILRIKK